MRHVWWGDKVEIVVVWDAWENIPQPERGRVITDAYETEHGRPTGLEVKRAMGFTEAEAKRQNIVPPKDTSG